MTTNQAWAALANNTPVKWSTFPTRQQLYIYEILGGKATLVNDQRVIVGYNVPFHECTLAGGGDCLKNLSG